MKSLNEWEVERFAEDNDLDLTYLRQIMGGTTMRAEPRVRQMLKSRGIIDELLDMFPNPETAMRELITATFAEIENLPNSFDVNKVRKGFEDSKPTGPEGELDAADLER